MGFTRIGMTWFCFIASRRAEFLAANEIWLNLRCETFLPYSIERVRHARRQTEAKRPLYSPYVFVQCALGDIGQVGRQRGVERILSDPSGPVAIPDKLLEPELAKGVVRVLTAEQRARIKAGSRWRILDGAFSGHWAKVAVDNGKEIAVLVALLGRELEVTVAPEALIGSP